MKKVEKTNQPNLLSKHESVVSADNLEDNELRAAFDALLKHLDLSLVVTYKDFAKTIRVVKNKDIT